MQLEDNPTYMIGQIAKMLEIHPQTLRQYERDGLISPSRTKGRVRLYSSNDLKQIELTLQLIREYGINVAGVQMIIQLKKHEQSMTKEIESLRKGLNSIGAKGQQIEQSIMHCKENMDISINWCY